MPIFMLKQYFSHAKEKSLHFLVLKSGSKKVSGIESTDFILLPRLFRLGTTSFIVPDHIIPNVMKLGYFFDEIELLVFESDPLDWMSFLQKRM
jgi:hypothetical protein